MPQATADSPGSLLGQDVITTNATPVMGHINPYDATSGPLAPVLRQAAAGVLGTTCLTKKVDSSANAVTVTCYAGETFTDGTTTRVLVDPGDFIELLIVAASDNVARWEVVGSSATTIDARARYGSGYVAPVRVATNTETLTISGGSVTTIAGTTVDGVSAAVGMRVLIPNAPASTGAASGTTLSAQPANGVYVVTAVATNISVARAVEMSSTFAYNPAGWRVTVTAGTVNGGRTFVVVSPTNPAATMTWGTTNVQFQGALQGVTIGDTTPAASINSAVLTQSIGPGTVLSGSTSQPWLNQLGWYRGNLAGGVGCVNSMAWTDQVNYTGSNQLVGLQIYDSVASPAVGPRLGLFSKVIVSSAGTNTYAQAQYVGVTGRGEITVGLGGTGMGLGQPIGACWGGWFTGAIDAGTNHAEVWGTEINVSVASGASVFSKVGLLVVLAGADTVRGSVNDAALQIAKQTPVTCSWQNGILFGSEQGSVATPSITYTSWPFDSTSTMIKASTPGAGTLPANIGIDFSTVTFTDAAIKVGPATIELSEMSSAPAQVAGVGRLYVASDGSLHYLGPTTDTQLAPA